MAQMEKSTTFGKQHVIKCQTHGDGAHGVLGTLLVVMYRQPQIQRIHWQLLITCILASRSLPVFIHNIIFGIFQLSLNR